MTNKQLTKRYTAPRGVVDGRLPTTDLQPIKQAHYWTPLACLDIFLNNPHILDGFDVLISPDKRGRDTVADIARIKNLKVIELNKVFDPGTRIHTGYSMETPINTQSMEGKNILVIGYICDEGNTFELLADSVLKVLNVPVHLSLYVTHGIFTRGVNCKELRNYTWIITTNSVYDHKLIDHNVMVVKL